MKKGKNIDILPVSVEEKLRMKRFWVTSFAIYAAIDAILIILNYTITKSMCRHCVLPPVFYLIQWIFSLLFTAGLWYSMNALYSKNRWINVLVNIVLFMAHYLLWISMLYTVMHSEQAWLLGRSNIPGWSDLVYGSWYDIGKYVLKATAFYVLKSYAEYRRTERQRIELAVLNKDMQLNLLKQQLSPHFYFNTLNNLYGLARSNSPKLQDALTQLSNIMQYVIVDCNKPKVLLSHEVNFLQSYIALEKLRYEQNTVIDMQVVGQVNGQSILPLLLIQFVENAFKHGMKEKSEQNWMKVNLSINKDHLLFSVDNSYYTSEHAEGIGINSVKHRLNLQYEGKYDMKMEHEGHRFSVTLKLDLS
jgi:sensor histidine kinase YesM